MYYLIKEDTTNYNHLGNSTYHHVDAQSRYCTIITSDFKFEILLVLGVYKDISY